MINIRLAGWMGLLCVFLLTGCGNKSGDTSISGSDSSGDVSQFQEMTTEELEPVFTRRAVRSRIGAWKKKDGHRTPAT